MIPANNTYKLDGQNDNAEIISVTLKGLSKEAQQEELDLMMVYGHLELVIHNITINPHSQLAEELNNPMLEIEKASVCKCCEKRIGGFKTFPVKDHGAQVYWLNLESACEDCMNRQLSALLPMNPMEGWPPIFVCPCGNLAAIQMSVHREAIEKEPQPDDEYKTYEPGDINGTIVCAKCKTKMTYNIETPKG